MAHIPRGPTNCLYWLQIFATSGWLQKRHRIVGQTPRAAKRCSGPFTNCFWASRGSFWGVFILRPDHPTHKSFSSEIFVGGRFFGHIGCKSLLCSTSYKNITEGSGSCHENGVRDRSQIVSGPQVSGSTPTCFVVFSKSIPRLPETS